jgi:short-subunit dehydrogenase
VLTVKPGIVRTPMTEGLPAAGSPLAADPETVARDIERAIVRRQDVLYTPWFWWPVMTVICGIPESLFKRLRL